MPRLAAVTGATGFVGPHLVAALARHGWKLRLLIRRWTPLPSLAGRRGRDRLGRPVRRGEPQGAGRRRRCRGPCRRPDQGAPAGRVRPGQSRRHRPAVGARARRARSCCCRRWRRASRSSRPMPPASGRPRRSWRRRVRPVARRPRAGGLRAGRPRDAGLLQDGQARLRPAARPAGRAPVADPCRGPGRGAGARPRSRPCRRACTKIDDGHPGGYGHADMAAAAAEAFGRPVRTLPVGQGLMNAVAGLNSLRPGAQILIPWKGTGIVPPRLDRARTGASPPDGCFRPVWARPTASATPSCWYRAHGLAVKHGVTICYFT